MVNLKEGIPFQGKFVKSGDVYRVTLSKKIFEFWKLEIGKLYDFIVKEHKK